ncbi:MAG TPA: hypothetical protein VML00_08060 [Bacteroidota bacterium]|nr:hypothetical protein [Bacteroidota bacterium]
MLLLTSEIGLLTRTYGGIWTHVAPGLPAGRRFSPGQQAEREREVDLLMEKSLPRIDRFSSMEDAERARYAGRAHTALGKLLMDGADPRVDRFFDQCEVTGKEFVRRARNFDRALSGDDIHQALRNQWVFNSIEAFLGRSVSLSPGSLAYSLMYPYTDNWLDAANHTAEEREEFQESLRRCLEGKPGPGDQETFPRLVRMIEEEFPRAGHPAVYDALLAILRAQGRGLRLQGPVGEVGESALESITIEKGGASVAVDGFLVRGRLSAAELHAVFGYGVVLQFIDDLQDMEEDAAAGHSTMFTRASAGTALDDLTGRLIRFTDATVALLDSPAGGFLPRLVGASCLFLILEAVARHSDRYTPRFLEMLEEFSPLRFPFLAGLHDRARSAMAGREDLLMSA